MAKLNFQQSLLQSSVSHGPSEITVICAYLVLKKHLIINAEISCAAYTLHNFWSSSG